MSPDPDRPEGAPRPVRSVTGYSRLVRGLKIGLPLLGLAMLSAIFLLPRQSGLEGGLSYSSADLLALGQGLSVTRPRITGVTADGAPFAVEADRATPDGPDPERVDLDNVRARFEEGARRRIDLTADEGRLRPREQRLALTGAVRLTTSDGYVVETDRVEADLRAGEIAAPGPVRASGPSGAIEAGSFRARRMTGREVGRETDAAPLGAPRAGDYLWFEDGVRVTWTPSPQDDDAPRP